MPKEKFLGIMYERLRKRKRERNDLDYMTIKGTRFSLWENTLNILPFLIFGGDKPRYDIYLEDDPYLRDTWGQPEKTWTHIRCIQGQSGKEVYIDRTYPVQPEDIDYVYHVAPADKLDEIIYNGITPQNHRESGGRTDVYMSAFEQELIKERKANNLHNQWHKDAGYIWVPQGYE